MTGIACRQSSWRWNGHQNGWKCIGVGINIILVKRLATVFCHCLLYYVCCICCYIMYAAFAVIVIFRNCNICYCIFNYKIIPAMLSNTYLFILQGSALADWGCDGRF